MPRVSVYISKLVIPPNGLYGDLKLLIASIPDIVARHLTSADADGKLTSDDVLLRVYEEGKFDHFPEYFEVIIEAQRFLCRATNLDERRKQILLDLCAAAPKHIYPCVWVILHEGSWGESKHFLR